MYDVIVIGGGPAGVTAALRCRELGATVALVERGRLGGTCTNDGCVPTRVLAKAARLLRDSEDFGMYGLIGERPKVDFAAVMSRTQQVVYTIQEKKQLINHLTEAGVTLYTRTGDVSFADPHTIKLHHGEPPRLEAAQFILCVGGHARRLNFPGAEYTLTHSDVWNLRTLPRSMVIVGAAATGCQLASIFDTFGSKVTLLELAPRILAGEDEAVSRIVDRVFRTHGIEITTGIGGIDRIEKTADGLRVYYKQGEEVVPLDAEAVVMAVGWPGNVEGLNLASVGVQTDRGYVKVDDLLRSSAPHIFAAGDITGRMMLVQSATYDARIAAENAVLGTQETYRHQIVPHGGFTDPEYASVGMTEAQAKAREDVAVAVVPYADMDRAVIDGHTEGLCKLIVSRESQQIVGAHVAGEQALEVIHLVASGMAAGMTVRQLAELEIAYPTFAAVVGLAARRLVRELGMTPLATEWRTLSAAPFAEWEWRDGRE
jgi:dihydrolipoamide dehydrogenase